MNNQENPPRQNTFNISGGSIRNLAGSGNINHNENFAGVDNYPFQEIENCQSSSPEPIKILFAAANPLDTSRLRLGKEVRNIREGLKRSENRDDFVFEERWAVRANDLSRALLEVKPRI
ncbi:MAG: serine protease, partial [Cyanobacteria bacterium J06598_3]